METSRLTYTSRRLYNVPGYFSGNGFKAISLLREGLPKKLSGLILVPANSQDPLQAK